MICTSYLQGSLDLNQRLQCTLRVDKFSLGLGVQELVSSFSLLELLLKETLPYLEVKMHLFLK